MSQGPNRWRLWTARLAPLAGVVLMLGWSAPAAAQALQAADRLQLANGLYAREMFDMAAKEYQSCLQQFPEAPGADSAWFRLGECLRHLGKNREAEVAFRTVATRFPASPFRQRAVFRRADLFMALGQFAAAVDLFGELLKENPPADIAASATYQRGQAYLKSGKPQEAAAQFEAVRASFTNESFRAYALLELGGLYGEAGGPLFDAAKAQSCYEAAIAKPLSERVGAEGLFQLAEFFFRQKAFPQSSATYQRLLATYPNDTRAREARLQAAWAAHNAGQYLDGMRLAGEGLTAATEPKARAEWLYLKANCARQLLKQEEALAAYTELQSVAPGTPYAEPGRYEQALTLLKLNRFAEAVALAEPLQTSATLKRDVYWLLAEAHTGQKNEAGAVQYYRLLIRDFPQSDIAGEAAYRLAHHMQERRDYVEAARLYHGVAEGFPTGALAPLALFAAAYCLQGTNQQAEAVRDWDAVVTRFPQHALVEESLYQKGLGEVRLQRNDNALATLRDLLRRFPASKYKADACYWIGIVHKEAGRWQDAEEQLRLCLQSQPRTEVERTARYFLGVALQHNNKPAEAADCFQALLDSPLQDRFSAPLLEWLAEYRFQSGRFDDAINAARLLLRRAGEPDWQQIGWCLVGRAEVQLGRKQEAAAAFRRALESGATTRYAAEAALLLGDLLVASQDAKGAVTSYEKAAALANDDALLGVRARAYAGLGKAADAEGRKDDAVRYYLSVGILFDDPELVPESLGRASVLLKELGRADESRKTLGELLQRYPDSAAAKQAKGG